MKNETFCDRFIQLVDYYGRGNKTFFAKLIDVTESNVRSWMNNTLPKVDVIEKIAKNCENLSLEWLVTGAGSMLKSEEKGAEMRSAGADEGVESASNGVITALKDIIKEQSNEIARLELRIQQLEAAAQPCQEARTA